MKKPILWSVCLSGLLMAVAVQAAPVTVGEDQRSGLGVTLYSTGLALIDDARSAQLVMGVNELELPGISPNMLVPSAQLITDRPVDMIEQGLLPANLTPSELLKAYVGKRLKLIRVHPTTGEEITRDVEVLAVDPQPILRIDNQIETTIPGRLVFPEIPDGFRARPLFRVLARADAAAPTALRLQYLTHGLSWQADHVAAFDEASGRLKLQTRATLVNNSGLDLINSRIQMVAGQVNQVTPAPRMEAAPRLLKAQSMVMADTAAAPSLQSLEGYHLYSLNRPVTVRDGHSKQVPLVPVQWLPAKRQLISDGQPNIYGQMTSSQPSHPRIEIEFTNKATDSQPLPGGTVRLYGADDQQVAQFLGEDRLADLPVGETATITAGQAFDVTVRRKQTGFKREVMGRNTFEAAFEVQILNGSDRPETVIVRERMAGDWSFAEDSPAFRRDGDQAVWTVTVAAGGAATATYRVRVRR